VTTRAPASTSGATSFTRGSGFFRVLISILAALGSVSVLAQAPPDAGRILQETRPPERAPAVTVPPILVPTQPRPALPAASGDVRVQVSHFEFTGNRALSADVLRAAVAPWAGRSLNFGELIEVVEAIEARYKDAGYFLAQGYLPPQQIKDGAIEIAISEGNMGEARLEGESRVAADVLFRYLDRLPKGEAITLPILERQVLLINELAGGRASLDLQAGEQSGTTDVVLAQQPEALIAGRVDANNHGSPSTGEKRFSLNLDANSALNLGERLTASALTTDTGKLTSYNLRGEFPVGGDGWRLSVGASRAEYSLGGAFSSLEASGQADSWRIGAAYPLIRSRAANLKLQLEADQSKLADKFRAANTELDKRSRGFTLTASGDWLDEFMGGGSTRADVALRAGNLSLDAGAAATDAPPAGPGTAGSFSKTTLTAQRQQTLTRDLSLQARLTWQFAGKNLDSSEKLILGGPTTLPGYAVGETSGDSGALAKLALRWQALPELALTAFADYGRLQLAHDPLPTVTKNNKRLSDAGLGADWLIGKGFNASAILAWAGKEAPNPADNDKPRLWLSLGYAW
jgi:hemolysin activation/secretion protein